MYILEKNGRMILTEENRRTQRKTCPSTTFSTTNPTRIDPGANSGLRGERPATNRLSHGTAAIHHHTPIYLYKLILDNQRTEQVSEFHYLGCQLSYQCEGDVHHKLEKFNYMCSKIKTLKDETRMETRIKFIK
jgi:hypothetical protein